MGMIAVCDGCGEQSPAVAGRDHNWHKPSLWFERSDDEGIQTACSRECIKKIAGASGKTSVVLPV